MGFRKISADSIFDGHQFEKNKVLILKENGVVENMIPISEAGEGVEHISGQLTPGFINCHCHLELSHMKGLIPEGTGLVDFVFNLITHRHTAQEEILAGIKTGEDEMVNSGIVAVGDICNNAFTLSQKRKQRIDYYNFIEASGWLPSVSENRIKNAYTLFMDFSELSALHHLSSIVPHAPYSVSKELWALILPYYKNKVVSMHNQESASENPFFEEGKGDFNRMYELMNIDNSHHVASGKSSLQSSFNYLQAASQILLVHNTYTKQRDLDYIRDSGRSNQVWFCLCVNANLYIEKALPPLQLIREHGFQIVLGTDSLASNHHLSIVEEIKTIQNNWPHIPLEEILKWATLNGAKALGMDRQLGSFQKGKQPGILNLVGKGANLTVKKLG
ncbi:MAG: hypothetical protein NVS9B7_24190 [Flavisolibacter sp.]